MNSCFKWTKHVSSNTANYPALFSGSKKSKKNQKYSHWFYTFYTEEKAKIFSIYNSSCTQIPFAIISPRSENYSEIVISHDTFFVRSSFLFLFPFYSEANHWSNVIKKNIIKLWYTLLQKKIQCVGRGLAFARFSNKR